MAELTEHRCHVCGWPIGPGVVVCPNCAERLDEPPSPRRPVAEPESEPTGLILVLPDHRALPLVEGEPIELGRDTGLAQMDSTLAPYTDVSRHHAVVELVGGMPMLSVIAVDNTTAVEDAQVAGTVPVEAGQRIRLAEHCWLQVRGA